jgi:hypothetical protein
MARLSGLKHSPRALELDPSGAGNWLEKIPSKNKVEPFWRRLSRQAKS